MVNALENLARWLMSVNPDPNANLPLPEGPPTPQAVANAWIDAHRRDDPARLPARMAGHWDTTEIILRSAWTLRWPGVRRLERRPDLDGLDPDIDGLAAYRVTLAAEIERYVYLFADAPAPAHNPLFKDREDLLKDFPNPDRTPLQELAPLVLAWLQQPRPVRPNLRQDRIMVAKLAHVSPDHPRAPRLLKLFSAAAHRSGQLALPGFGPFDDPGAPALPLTLYQLGEDTPHHGGGRGAPLALRLFVEAVLAVGLADRRDGQPVALNIPLRELLSRLYPGPRRPRPNEYWPRLMRAAAALDTMDARIPWHDPTTGRGGLRRVVSM